MSDDCSDIDSNENSNNDKVNNNEFYDVIQVWNKYPQYLRPIFGDDLEDEFLKIVEISFDVSEEIIQDICRYDYLWFPTELPNGTRNLNYYQTLNESLSKERDFIENVFSYLFANAEPQYGEFYDRSPLELKNIRKFYDYICTKYARPQDYIERVCRILWYDSEDIIRIMELYQPFVSYRFFKHIAKHVKSCLLVQTNLPFELVDLALNYFHLIKKKSLKKLKF